jgi:inhibitor of KinA sporulation pathway (predicted exonuclease)
MNEPVPLPQTVLAIVDFEATCCDRQTIPREEMEIIEIGAVAVNAATGDVLSGFGTFIRPVRNPILTSFCTSLTTITQEEVDAAPGFPDALAAFAAWLGKFDTPGPGPVFCSWGDYDRKQLAKDCDFHRLRSPPHPETLRPRPSSRSPRPDLHRHPAPGDR